MLIRRADLPAEAAAVLAVQRDGYAVEAGLAGVPSLPSQHQSSDDLCREDLWVVETEGEIAAVMALEDGDEPLIAKLVVAPHRMRRGLGRALVAHAIGLAGERALRVGTAAANTPALALYAGLGFERSGAREVGDGIAFVDLRRPGGSV